MAKAVDFAGTRVGRWSVLEFAGHRGRHRLWRCRCDCGTEAIRPSQYLRNPRLVGCGCALRERPVTKGPHNPRIYTIWKGMLARCHSPTEPAFRWYGARGIAVCDEWRGDFSTFQAWAEANGYQDVLQIDRIDNDAGYSPGNCRWVTPRENTNNRRTSRRFEFRGEVMTIAQAAAKYALEPDTLRRRIMAGEKPDEAIIARPRRGRPARGGLHA